MNHPAWRCFTCGITLLSMTLLFLAACGGGGGAAPAAPPLPIDIGVQSSTTQAQVGRSFLNPLGSPAVVTALPSTGPFAFGPDNLGLTIGPFGNVSLDVLFTPEGPGVVTGIITLRWTAGGTVVDQRFEITATGESFNWTTTPDPVDFGDILPGESTEIEIRMRNNSQRSPVTFTNATLPPSGAFEFVGSPFPQTVQPGLSLILTVRFAPTVVANQGGVLRIGQGDLGGPVDVQLWANSTGAGEKVIEFGTQTLDGTGTTPELTLDVPADAASLTFEGSMTSSAEIGLRMLEGPGGKVYENASQTGPVLWQAAREAYSVHIPSTDGAATQLVAGGGTYRFQLFRFSGSGSTMEVRAIIERRPGGNNANATLPLNIFLAPAIGPTAATAAGDAKVQGAISRMDQILQTRGTRIGEITYYDIADPAFNNIAQGEEVQLFRTSSAASKVRLNLFFVQTVWAGQLYGISGAIDGARTNGDGVSGVAVQWFQLDADTVGTIAAHECLHYLGVWHTVEVNGTWDLINDTPECPPMGTNSNCSIAGGGMLMHWQLLDGLAISAGQGLVLRGHAHLHPPGQTGQKLRPLVQKPLSEQAKIELSNLPHGWCGCQRR